MTCPVCGTEGGDIFLRRADVPVHQNLVMPSRQAALDIRRGSLEMCCCWRCGFVFNRAFDSDLLEYGAAYDNTQSYSPAFKAYLDSLVNYLIGECGVRDARVVEVGCGKGYFLRKLIESEPTNRGCGYDPSYVGADTDLNGRLQFRRELYGPGSEENRADVIVCRHVIEHLADPVALLKTVRSALEHSPDARVFFETPSIEWILHNRVSWDFFYEHCSLFSEQSLATAFARAGFHTNAISRVFDGQYLWLEASISPPGQSEAAPNPAGVPKMASHFTSTEAEWKTHWTHRLQARSGANIAIWGAGAKGVTFANLIDPDCQLVDCIVDLNPRKQGHYLPGTGHLIVGPHQLGERGVAAAILMNPNYRSENETLLRQLGLAVALEEE